MENFTLTLVLAAAFASVLVIIMARYLPWNMMGEWNESIVENERFVPPELNRADFALSLNAKIAICAGCVALSLLAALAYPVQFDASIMCVYFLGLVLMVAINLKHQLLVDNVVLALLWVGLLYHVNSPNLVEYVAGAIIGYAVPWGLSLLIGLFYRKELIAPADPKALAMAGAWFGMAALPFLFGVFLLAAIVWAFASGIFLKKKMVDTGPAHMIASLSYVIATRFF
jgi:leader peptidase (prepilin peptidase)/N-methyltransferase